MSSDSTSPSENPSPRSSERIFEIDVPAVDIASIAGLASAMSCSDFMSELREVIDARWADRFGVEVFRHPLRAVGVDESLEEFHGVRLGAREVMRGAAPGLVTGDVASHHLPPVGV